jgi:hypothetical protein
VFKRRRKLKIKLPLHKFSIVKAAALFALQESSSCKAKTLRVDATDAQMKMQAELARISAQRAQSALCFLTKYVYCHMDLAWIRPEIISPARPSVRGDNRRRH